MFGGGQTWSLFDEMWPKQISFLNLRIRKDEK